MGRICRRRLSLSGHPAHCEASSEYLRRSDPQHAKNAFSPVGHVRRMALIEVSRVASTQRECLVTERDRQFAIENIIEAFALARRRGCHMAWRHGHEQRLHLVFRLAAREPYVPNVHVRFEDFRLRRPADDLSARRRVDKVVNIDSQCSRDRNQRHDRGCRLATLHLRQKRGRQARFLG